MSVEWDILEVPAVRYEYIEQFFKNFIINTKKKKKSETKRNETDLEIYAYACIQFIFLLTEQHSSV